jgi:hypothetical protein
MENTIKAVFTFNDTEVTYTETFDGPLTMNQLDTMAWKAGQALKAQPKVKRSGITETVKQLA